MRWIIIEYAHISCVQNDLIVVHMCRCVVYYSVNIFLIWLCLHSIFNLFILHIALIRAQILLTAFSYTWHSPCAQCTASGKCNWLNMLILHLHLFAYAILNLIRIPIARSSSRISYTISIKGRMKTRMETIDKTFVYYFRVFSRAFFSATAVTLFSHSLYIFHTLPWQYFVLPKQKQKQTGKKKTMWIVIADSITHIADQIRAPTLAIWHTLCNFILFLCQCHTCGSFFIYISVYRHCHFIGRWINK